MSNFLQDMFKITPLGMMIEAGKDGAISSPFGMGLQGLMHAMQPKEKGNGRRNGMGRRNDGLMGGLHRMGQQPWGMDQQQGMMGQGFAPPQQPQMPEAGMTQGQYRPWQPQARTGGMY